MKTFSERKGLKPVRQTIQTDVMTDELRNSLWNTLQLIVWDSRDFMHDRYGNHPGIDGFSELLWFRYFKKPIDERPSYAYSNRSEKILKIIRDYFFAASWNEVYDFLEFVVAACQKGNSRLSDTLNRVLSTEMSAYRFVDGKVVDMLENRNVKCSRRL